MLKINDHELENIAGGVCMAIITNHNFDPVKEIILPQTASESLFAAFNGETGEPTPVISVRFEGCGD